MNLNDNKKTCIRCKTQKDVNLFGKYNRNKDGFRSYCKDCKSKEDKNRYNICKKPLETKDLLEIVINSMKNNIDNYNELVKLRDEMTKLLYNLEIENKITSTNSFIVKNIEKYSYDDEMFKTDIIIKLLNVGVFVNSEDIYFIKRDKEYIVQLDNINLSVDQKIQLSE